MTGAPASSSPSRQIDAVGGGELLAESIPSEGSTFTLVLPKHPVPKLPREQAHPLWANSNDALSRL